MIEDVSTTTASETRRLTNQKGLVAHTLGSADSLHFKFLTGGHLHSVNFGSDLMLNLLFGDPLAGALQRVYVELWSETGRLVVPLIAPESNASFSADTKEALWTVQEEAFTLQAILSISATGLGWSLAVIFENSRTTPVAWRVLNGLDVGLGNAAGIRINEAYTSQYLDHRALPHSTCGSVLASRQNIAVEGRHPVLLQSCLRGCEDFATDARDVFGGPAARDHILPVSLVDEGYRLPGVRQGEGAYVVLRSPRLELASEATDVCAFRGQLIPHLPTATDALELEACEVVAPLPTAKVRSVLENVAAPKSLFHVPRVRHGAIGYEPPSRGSVRLLEKGPEGEAYSWFTTEGAHVVTRAKEAVSARSHATILRSGRADFPASNQLSTTCFAAGIFNSLVACGHVSFHRLLSYPRESCGLMANVGQRIWIEEADGGWSLLGVPTFFEVGLTEAHWRYELEEATIEVSVVADCSESLATLRISVVEGGPRRFLITHGLIGGINEYDAPAKVIFYPADGIAEVQADRENPMRKVDPTVAFQIAAEDALQVEHVGGAEMVGSERSDLALIAFSTRPVSSFALRLSGRSEKTVVENEAAGDWREQAEGLKLSIASDAPSVERLSSILPWYVHNGMIHCTAPHGIEQYNGGAWGTRDVTQGSVELLLAVGSHWSCRRIILETYAHQYAKALNWPQWFMLEPFGHIQQKHSHGDIPLWPLKSLCDYLEATNDFSILDAPVDWTSDDDGQAMGQPTSLFAHVEANVRWLRDHCLPGTALLGYGDGDWNDSLQPADPALRERLVSAWTVSLCYQVLRRLEAVCVRCGRAVDGLAGFADDVARDFRRFLVSDGTVCGFFLFDQNSWTTGQPLLHPDDRKTGVHYRLLPMTRSMIGGLFDAEEAAHHADLIDEHLLTADGARLMNRPPVYKGGTMSIFQRAESSPCFSREIGIMYTHAHLRYIEAMVRLGRAEAALKGFDFVNPAGLNQTVPHALPRQANAYFSSSDAVVSTRYEAEERYDEIREGNVAVEGGWRIYSSGPGIFVGLVLTRWIGLRRHYGHVVIDPVLPKSLHGLEVVMPWEGSRLHLRFKIEHACHTPRAIVLNGIPLKKEGLSDNPYRTGGWMVSIRDFRARCHGDGGDRLEISL